MKQYKILLFQLGHIFLSAESEADALSQLKSIPKESIIWLPNIEDDADQNSNYFIASIKCSDH